MAEMDPVESNLRATTSREVGEPDWLDQVEARLFALGGRLPTPEKGEVEGFPITHRFTPGLCVREIKMPANSIVVSKIHKTEHPYVVSQGSLWVLVEGEGWKHIVAPFTGVTMPGTRRLLIVETDTVWTTFHPTESTDWAEIEAQLVEYHDNPLLKPVSPIVAGEIQ